MSQTPRIFGTDGVRGQANVFPMTVEMATAIGRGVAEVFKNHSRRHRILIGKDTRLSGYMFENALVAGILSMGVDAQVVGPIPTPAIAFLTRSMRADAGIVISASHNPYEDNGIKIFARDGFKLPDSLEETIEQYALGALSGADQIARPTAAAIGKATRIDDAQGRYIVFAKHSFPQAYTLDGFKIALDCAHGATYKVAPAIFYELGAKVYTIGAEPDGLNINDQRGSLYPETLQALVREKGCNVGLAFDGDGDRLIMVDERGELIDGDQVMALSADHMMNQGRLNQATLVATVMSNLGLEICLRERGIRLLRTQVGDRYVVEAMREGGYNLGGEQSGHIIHLDYNTTGDGILTALQVLRVMCAREKPLSELANIMTPVPQKLVNLKVGEKKPFADCPQLTGAMDACEADLGEKGRILVRYSGTEAKLRIMVEALDAGLMDRAVDRLAQAARDDLGSGEA